MKRIIYIIPLILIMTVLFCLTGFSQTVTPSLTDEISIRVAEPYGLRVVASIDKAQAYDENTTEFGFVATRLVLMQMYDVYVSDLAVDSAVPKKNGVSKRIVDGESVINNFRVTETEVQYGVYFHGINEYNYLDQIVVRPYAVNNGVYGYGDVFVTSLYDQARIAYDSPYFDELGKDGKRVISQIVEFSESAFSPSEEELRIVLDVTVSQTDKGYYSNLYRVLNLADGSVEYISGNREFVNEADVKAFAKSGSIVALEGKKIEDRIYNSVVGELDFDDEMWIRDCSDGKITLVPADKTLSCKDCINEYVNASPAVVIAAESGATFTAVVKKDGEETFENSSVGKVTVDEISAKSTEFLCKYSDEEQTLYSDYVKVMAVRDEDGDVESIIVVVNDNENSAKGEKCDNHGIKTPSELIESLKKGQTEIKKLRVSGYAKQARDLVVTTITSLLADADKGAYIDSDYVYAEYGENVRKVKKIINEDMNSTDRSNFLNNIKNNVSKDVRNFLIEYFDINTDSV